MTYEQLMTLLWRWKYGPVQGEPDQRIVTINDVRQAVVQYEQAEAEKRATVTEEAVKRVKALADRKEREAAAFLGLSGRVGPVNIGSDDLRAALASPAPADD